LREGYSEAVAGVGGVGDEEATKKWSRINPNAHSNNKNTEKYCKIIGHLPIMARFSMSGLDADDADKERERRMVKQGCRSCSGHWVCAISIDHIGRNPHNLFTDDMHEEALNPVPPPTTAC
jgi:hypothetical protein